MGKRGELERGQIDSVQSHPRSDLLGRPRDCDRMRFAVTFNTINLDGDLEQAGAERPVRLVESQYRLLCLHQYKLLRKIPGSTQIGSNKRAGKNPRLFISPIKFNLRRPGAIFMVSGPRFSGSEIVDLCRRLRLKKSSRSEFREKISVTGKGFFAHLYL